MPNATVRANAQAMPNRRAALASLFAAGAALAAPGVAQANESDADLDADLFALLEPIEAADRELEAVLDVLNTAEEKHYARVRRPKPAEPPMDSASAQAIEEFGRRMAEIQKRGPSAERIAYDEALRQWEAEEARIEAESGIDEAEAAEAVALDAVTELQALVAETPARTLAGLIFKAQYAAERDHDPIVMESFIDDLIDMAGES